MLWRSLLSSVLGAPSKSERASSFRLAFTGKTAKVAGVEVPNGIGEFVEVCPEGSPDSIREPSQAIRAEASGTMHKTDTVINMAAIELLGRLVRGLFEHLAIPWDEGKGQGVVGEAKVFIVVLVVHV